MQKQQIIQQLETFGLGALEGEVYLHLLINGEATALQISREVTIGRTRVYRILDDLYEMDIVYQRLESNGLVFGAQDVSKLKIILDKKETRLQELKKSSVALFEEMRNLAPTFSRESEIRYYKGAKGLEQVTWNSTKAKDVLRIYEIGETMEGFIDYKVAETIREEFVSNNVSVRQLTNHKLIRDFTDVSEHVSMWTPRFIHPNRLKIQFEVLIYNNVYTMYRYANNDVFCVEIYDENLARMQSQIFDFVWESAKLMKKFGKRGEARVNTDKN